MIRDKDFLSSMKLTFDRSYHCDEIGCGTSCYCSTIGNCKITSIDVSDIVGKIYSIYFDDSDESKRDSKINSIFGISKEVDIYTIDRIVRHFKIWESHKWHISIIKKYYGEEIDKVSILSSVAKEIEDALENAFSIIDLKDRINFLLNLEYGYLLPELENNNYTLLKVNKSELIFPVESNGERVEYYSDRNYFSIRGIVTDKMRVIDGYHRLLSTDSELVLVLKSTN